jgi:hypothetical protein
MGDRFRGDEGRSSAARALVARRDRPRHQPCAGRAAQLGEARPPLSSVGATRSPGPARRARERSRIAPSALARSRSDDSRREPAVEEALVSACSAGLSDVWTGRSARPPTTSRALSCGDTRAV